FSSITKFHARSFALLLLACGLMSAFWGGNALSTLIVVGNSRSSTFRNCSFSVMAPPWSRALVRGGSSFRRQVYTYVGGRSRRRPREGAGTIFAFAAGSTRLYLRR